jgi:hypothetical protein
MQDKLQIQTIAERLRSENIKVFLDRWCLTPGMPWQTEIAQALNNSRKVAIFIGPHETGPWHHMEMQLALFKKEAGDVIPVLLPGCDATQIPEFLGVFTWINLGDEDLSRLIAVIKNAQTSHRSAAFRLLIDQLSHFNYSSHVIVLLHKKCVIPPEIAFVVPSDFEERIVGALKTADKSFLEANLLRADEIRDKGKLKEYMIDAAFDTLLAVMGCVQRKSVVGGP